MKLTALEVRRISICTRKNQGATLSELADEFDCSVSAISNAIAWGKSNRYFNIAASLNVNAAIVSLQKRQTDLDKQFKLRMKHSESKALPTAFLSMYFRETRRYELAIAELAGLLNRTMNVDVSGTIKHEHTVDYSRLTDDDLTQIKAMQEKVRVHGSN